MMSNPEKFEEKKYLWEGKKQGEKTTRASTQGKEKRGYGVSFWRVTNE